MENKNGKQFTERQRRNMQFTEDRIELLDTIRELIDIELDRRDMSILKPKLGQEKPTYAEAYDEPIESPPPEHYSPQPKRRSFWQRIMSILTADSEWRKCTIRDRNTA